MPINEKNVSSSKKMKAKLPFLLFICSLFFLSSCSKEGESVNENLVYELPEQLVLEAQNWMTWLLLTHKNQSIRLKDICLPRAHDAGNYLETECTTGGTACNTRTQILDMAAQLNAGIRVFDMRPVKHTDGEFYAYHTSDCGGLGCNGDSFENMLLAVRNFLDTNSELVILDINHLCETSSGDAELTDLISSTLGERMYRETETTEFNLGLKPLIELVDLDNKKGIAVVTYEDLSANTENRQAGLFAQAAFPTQGSYSNNPVLKK